MHDRGEQSTERPPFFMRYKGELYDLSGHTVMGIVNLTPDSFHAPSRAATDRQIIEAVGKHIDGGAQIIDIGGYSSRPGADEVDPKLETFNILWGIERIKSAFGENMPVSIDTFRASVARKAVEHYGAVIVNDITAGEGDPEMLDVVAEYKLPYIAMHMRGTPATMQSMTDYDDVVGEVIDYFCRRMELFEEKGVEDVRIDPGFGFAKTAEQNFELLRRLDEFGLFRRPVLAGLSRKSMIWRTLGGTPADALTGTVALNWAALERGANILRVHDSREASETIKLFEAMQKTAND